METLGKIPALKGGLIRCTLAAGLLWVLLGLGISAHSFA